jgi:hypothetical protein
MTDTECPTCAQLAAERDAARADWRRLAAGATAAIDERDEATRALRNLAAVIDRDGGQAQEGETVGQTSERCVDLVYAMRADRDDAAGRREGIDAAARACDAVFVKLRAEMWAADDTGDDERAGWLDRVAMAAAECRDAIRALTAPSGERREGEGE